MSRVADDGGGGKQRHAGIRIALVRIEAAVEQLAHGVDVAGSRGEPDVVFARRVEGGLQQGEDFLTARFQRLARHVDLQHVQNVAGGLPVQGDHVPRCLAVVVAHRGVGAGVQQNARGRGPAKESRRQQRRTAIAATGVHVGAVVEQPARGLALVAANGNGQRRHAELRFQAVQVCAGLQMRFQAVDVAFRCGFPQARQRLGRLDDFRLGGRRRAGADSEQKGCRRKRESGAQRQRRSAAFVHFDALYSAR